MGPGKLAPYEDLILSAMPGKLAPYEDLILSAMPGKLAPYTCTTGSFVRAELASAHFGERCGLSYRRA
jgi:hypothetical protein